MQRVRLAPEAPEFSAMAFGTWRLLNDAEVGTPEGLLRRLKTSLDLGITTIDTAEIYGGYRVEELVGAALALDAGVRGRMEIVTKAGIYVPCGFHPDRKTAFYNTTADRLVRSAEKSLRFLGVETIDLFLVHRPDWFTHPDETAAGLNRLVASGKVRAAGVSNYTVTQFDALSARVERPLVTNQVQFSPFCCDPLFDGTFDQCFARGIRPMAWSPTGGGRLFRGDDEAGARFRAAAEELGPHYGGAGVDQLCCAWSLSHPVGPLVITGTNRDERLRSFAGGAAIRLEREHWYALTEAARGRKIP